MLGKRWASSNGQEEALLRRVKDKCSIDNLEPWGSAPTPVLAGRQPGLYQGPGNNRINVPWRSRVFGYASDERAKTARP